MLTLLLKEFIHEAMLFFILSTCNHTPYISGLYVFAQNGFSDVPIFLIFDAWNLD